MTHAIAIPAASRARIVASIACAAALALLVAGCGEGARESSASPHEGPPRVYTDSYPLAYMAQRIGGERIAVHLPVPAGANPALWRPDDAVIRRYQAAELILLHGAGYARWVETAPLPRARTVDTSAAFRDRLLHVPDAQVHAHGDGPPHAHAGLASNTWLDPALAILHARAVAAALARRVPDAAAFADGLAQLEADLTALDEAFAATLAPAAAVPLLASWPLYHYPAARFDLDLRTLHWTPGRMPAAGEWETLDALLDTHPARHMLWPVKPVPPIVEALTARGIAVVVFALADRPGPDGDFLATMSANAGRFAAAFGGGASPPSGAD